MAATLNLGTDGNWAAKENSLLGYNSENDNFKPLPFDFTRASNATRVNKLGLIETVSTGQPRIDFQGNTNGSLLLEPQRTNLITESEAFDNSYWTKSGASVVGGFTSPSADSPLGAFKLVEDTANSRHFVNSSEFSTSGTVYSSSVYVKADGRNKIALRENAQTGNYASFNLSNGTLIATNGVSASIELISNGWYRINYQITSGNTIILGIELLSDSYTSGDPYSNPYQGNGTSGVYIYGAQVEEGSYPTSYIKTEGSAVTRVADAMNKASLGLTDCTFFVDFVPLSSIMGLLDFYDNSNARAFYIAINSINYLQFNSVQGGTIGNALGPITIGDKMKLAFTLNASTGDVTIFANGTKYSTYSTTISSLNKIAQVESFGYYNNTEFNQILTFGEILSDTDLATLTTL